MELDTVFESSGVSIPSSCSKLRNLSDKNGVSLGFASTNSTSPIPGSKPCDLSLGSITSLNRTSKTSMQLAIITKYNLACCCQASGESQKCIEYLTQAIKLLTFYSNIDNSSGLFKMNKQISTTSRLSRDYTRGVGESGIKTPNVKSYPTTINEYNQVGSTSQRNNYINDESQIDPQKLNHEQLSA